MRYKLTKLVIVTGIAASALFGSLNIEVQASTVPFEDTQVLDSRLQEKISILVDLQVVAGFPDNTFRPASKVTRGQFASFISRALSLSTPSQPKQFKDVTKRTSTYEGISRAYEAGIISGYRDGYFKPEEFISREQMAIMLDRALQYEGEYQITSHLWLYPDRKKINESAYEAVQRVIHYRVMKAQVGAANQFKPLEKGDRSSTAWSIYQLMKVKGLLPLDSSVPDSDTPPYRPDARDYTYEEIKKILKPVTTIQRSGGNDNGKIFVVDMVKEYYESTHARQINGQTLPTLQPETAYEVDLDALHNVHTLYLAQGKFTNYELIAINGIPYRYSEYFPDFLKSPDYSMAHDLNSIIAEPPIDKGEFLINIYRENADVVTYDKIYDNKTYTNQEILLEDIGTKPVMTESMDFLVDLQRVFNDSSQITVSDDGRLITYKDHVLELMPKSDQAILNGKRVTLSTSTNIQNERLMAPIQSVARSLGLHTRKLDELKNYAKIEVANYYLPTPDLDKHSFDADAPIDSKDSIYHGTAWME